MADHRVDPNRSLLFADLYQLTMAQAYDAEGMEGAAAFEIFFRTMPATRRFVVAAGLEASLEFLAHFEVTDDDLEHLRAHGGFDDRFIERLQRFRFTGDVDAVPEGTVVFPGEPIARVVAPIFEAQLVETMLLNHMHFESVAASKAARCVLAADGRTLVDFGARRAHGTDAAMRVARACWLVGADGTSNVLAGRLYGIPVFGTMAHSYIQAHGDERHAFEAFAKRYPGTTLLVDTWDTSDGVRRVIELSRTMGDAFDVRAIRLDSGDLNTVSRQTRAKLDEAGLDGVAIFASGGLDEYGVAALVQAGAPIDGYGVGTNLAVSADAPFLDMAYKLVEYDGAPKAKLSSAKATLPGRKQVFRTIRDDHFAGDVITRHDETSDGTPLLAPVMRGGERTDAGRVPLADARSYAMEQLRRLPESLRLVDPGGEAYPVTVSARLEADRDRFNATVGSR